MASDQLSSIQIAQNHSEVSRKARIEFIDLAKGVCIIFVVMDHSGFSIHDFGTNLAHLRMPLYFFLSGIFFKDYGGCGKTLLRKCDKLLIPFAFFFALNVVLTIFLKMVSHSPIPGLSYFFTNGRINVLSLWFLLCLFWQSMLYSIAYQFTGKVYNLAIITIVFSAIGITLSNYGVVLPLYLDSALNFSPFFFMGFSLRKTDILVPNCMDKFNIPIAICFIAIATTIGYANELTIVHWVYNEYEGKILLHFAHSCFIIFAAIFLCKTVNKLPLVSYIGRYSIIILVMHGIYLRVLASLTTVASYGLSTSMMFVAVLILSILSIEPMRRFLPHVTAQKNILSANFK